MTLREITEQIIREDSGGIFTDENRLDFDYIESLVHKARAVAVSNFYKQNKRLNPVCLQQYICPYSEVLQESNYFVRFPIPAFVNLDKRIDGLYYVGTTDGNCAYRKVNSRAELANFNNHRYTRGAVKYLYSDEYLEVYNSPMIEELRADAVFVNPVNVPTFNKEYDSYPISEDLIPIIQQIIYGTEGQKIASKPQDSLSDSADSTTILAKNK